MKTVEVTDRKLAKEFVRFQYRLLKKYPAYIRPLDKDVEAVFHTETNKAVKSGECCRWILIDEEGNTIGRVAAFVNHKTVHQDNDQPTGGMGFFDCIDDQEAANNLFDTCKKWLEDRGMEAMDGPINFGQRDRWWGLLVDGFDVEPNYVNNYNPPYYQKLFENYGFQDYFQQYTFSRDLMAPLSERIVEKAESVARDPNYHFRHAKKAEMAKYAEDFRTVYNKSWGRHSGVATMSKVQSVGIMNKMKPLMDERIMWFGYYKDDPICFFICIPEFNQIVKHLNGKLDLIGKLKFLYHKKAKTVTKALGFVFGVVPEHQGKGVEGALINASKSVYQDEPSQYKTIELNWIGDFNPKMLRVIHHIGAERKKTHITYRKLFDPSRPFKRAERIE